jgi:hypothetical protein
LNEGSAGKEITTVNRYLSISLLAILPLFAPNYAPATNPGESRKIAEQPELKRQLEAAPMLKTESLGEPAGGVKSDR